MKRKTAEKQAVKPPHEQALGRLQVNISNALTSAAQGLTLSEKRVMMFAVAKLDTFKRNGGAESGIVKLEQFGVDPDTAYDQLKSAGDGIFNRYIRFGEETRKGVKEVKIRWVSRAEYHAGEGWVALRFTSDVQPHLTVLSGEFTKYKLAQASALRSVYSWRLLELLSQYAKTGWRQFDLADFHHSMETSITARGNFKDCRLRVIEPAVKELREKDGWLIEWFPIKTGRKVTALRFEFKRDPQGKLEL